MVVPSKPQEPLPTHSGKESEEWLPQELSSFVGRSRELGEITELTGNHGLLTLFGPAGVGKTRLALRLLRDRMAAGGSGLFCDLRGVGDPAGMVAALSRRLDLILEESGSLDASVEALGRALDARGPCLLVIDNFEQLVPSACRVLVRWLCRASGVQLVVTSREVLRVPGERVFEVRPLALPGASPTWADESVALFAERAVAAEPAFLAEEVPVGTVASMVRLLGGVPLAIEIAAAQLRRVGIEQLADEIQTRLLDLQGSVRDAHPQHASLRAALGASWRRLTPEDRRLLGQLTVFRGGFTAGAAEAVLRSSTGVPEPVVNRLVRFREASLLGVEGVGAEKRWNYLDFVWRHATEHLSPEDERAAAARHASYFLQLGEDCVGKLQSRHSPAALAVLSLEFENLRRAFDWSVEENQAELAGRVALILHSTLRVSLPSLALDCVSSALTLVEDEAASASELVARLRCARADVACNRGDYRQAESDLGIARNAALADAGILMEVDYQEGILRHWLREPAVARECLERALAGARRAENAALESRILARLGWVIAEGFGDDDAFELYELSAAKCEAIGDLRGSLFPRLASQVHRGFFQLDRPVEPLARLLEEIRAVGDRSLEAMALQGLGICHHEAREFGQAREYLAEARQVAAEHGLEFVRSSVEKNLGALLDEIGDLRAAAEMYAKAAETAQRCGARGNHAVSLILDGGLLARQGDARAAATSLEGAERLLAECGDEGLRRLADLQRAQLTLCEAREAARSGEKRRSMQLKRQVNDVLRSLRPTESEAELEWPLADSIPEARVVLRLIERELSDERAASRSLRVWQDGSAFQLGDSPPVHLPRGPAIRRILKTLAAERLEEPGKPISTEALVAFGWPGQRVLRDSGSKRVREVVHRLRKAGLDGVLLSPGKGFLLDKDVIVTLVDEPFPTRSSG